MNVRSISHNVSLSFRVVRIVWANVVIENFDIITLESITSTSFPLARTILYLGQPLFSRYINTLCLAVSKQTLCTSIILKFCFVFTAIFSILVSFSFVPSFVHSRRKFYLFTIVFLSCAPKVSKDNPYFNAVEGVILPEFGASLDALKVMDSQSSFSISGRSICSFVLYVLQASMSSLHHSDKIMRSSGSNLNCRSHYAFLVNVKFVPVSIQIWSGAPALTFMQCLFKFFQGVVALMLRRKHSFWNSVPTNKMWISSPSTRFTTLILNM